MKKLRNFTTPASETCVSYDVHASRPKLSHPRVNRNTNSAGTAGTDTHLFRYILSVRIMDTMFTAAGLLAARTIHC